MLKNKVVARKQAAKPSSNNQGKKKTPKRLIGDHAERLAETFLRRQGIKVLERNFLCRCGEIDLICFDAAGKTLVFVEVRYRQHQNFGGGLESITAAKQAKLRRTAEYYLLIKGLTEHTARFDVIAIGGVLRRPNINWICNAF